MKLVYANYGMEIPLLENQNTVVVVENQKAYAEILEALWNQTNGGSSITGFILSQDEKIKDITKIIVAQRISTARNAKKIIVLDNGQIVGFDTHDNLMKNCEIYIDIYNSQLKKGGN